MFFDDRLATVLRHRAAGEQAARTQFRQLLDRLGNRKYGRDESLIAAAWLRLGALGEIIPAAERAKMIREPGWRFRSTELAAHLAEDEPEVAAAALSRANLDAEDWEELIPRLPVRARGFMRLRRDLPPEIKRILDQLGILDRGLPQPASAVPEANEAIEAPAATPAEPALTERDPVGSTEEPLELTEPEQLPQPTRPTATTGEEKSEIAALVERIAQFRRDRDSGVLPHDNSPRLPLEEEPHVRPKQAAGFGFVTDAAGRIEWAEPEVAPMVIGKRLMPLRRLGAQASRDRIARAFTAQQPIEAGTITLEGAPAIAGEWIVDAQPRFGGGSGRFHGYAGRFRRPAPLQDELSGAAREADRIRQLLHELRTPVNALQGFSEVIQQQLFGPAPHEYRALAASIAGDAASILAGFDELERLAKLETRVLQLEPGTCDLAPLITRMVDQLQHVLSPRMAGFDLEPVEDPIPIAMAEEEAEALSWRVLATLAGLCTAGEALELILRRERRVTRLWCELPSQLVAEEDVFAAKAKPTSRGLSAGFFGAGFSLRLARAESRAAGGDLVHEDDRICLTLPLDPAATRPSINGDQIARPAVGQHETAGN